MSSAVEPACALSQRTMVADATNPAVTQNATKDFFMGTILSMCRMPKQETKEDPWSSSFPNPIKLRKFVKVGDPLPRKLVRRGCFTPAHDHGDGLSVRN